MKEKALKSIIVNADDFGLNSSCTRAIGDALALGLITDTTLVANGTALEEALVRIKTDGLDGRIGIHFNLTEGPPLTPEMQECNEFVEHGVYRGCINRYKPLKKPVKRIVYIELSAQIMRLEKLGVNVTHADSHHHIHTAPIIAPILIRICKEHGLNKIRLHRNLGKIPLAKRIGKELFNIYLHLNGMKTTQYFGFVSDANSSKIRGSTELMVHPSYDSEGRLIDIVDYVKDMPIGVPIDEELAAYGGRYSSYAEL